ncbi:vascular-related unknown protein 1 [Ricinus communis]|uniref:Uncharacterized protein n=1 Tax=Ricinus communis TaxID=3988 RepID=B9SA47_RICCO|nr:vascular-related unknown protein 1 [Ricinus communis]EEF39564.1 conserved hypothetical protein [Ricinus communis]|eukprot:XP_002522866.1 vascular-related unknown protein 1 [Ricinus communis]
MEDYPSMNSTMRTLVSSSSNDERAILVVDDDDDDKYSFEESGWTMYLDDSFDNNGDENHSSFPFDDETAASSLVSDAASLIFKKSDGDLEKSGLPIDNNKSYSRLSFKKRKTKGALVDDSLEDTASSPVNSPKVYDIMNQFNKSIKQRDMDVSQDKGNNITSSDQLLDDRSNLGFLGRESDNTELKKRGLCLVPVSMVVNYFG